MSVLLALAFLLVPVRCDAASAAHSIFLTPAESGVALDGQHHHAEHEVTKESSTHAKAVPSKGMGAQHSAEAETTFLCGDDTTGPVTPDATADVAHGVATDTKSQSPVGATLYLPIPAILRSFHNHLTLETERLVEFPNPGQPIPAEPGSPDPPPPRLALG